MKHDSPTLDVEERISRCMTFELRFTSDLRLQTPIGAEKSSLTSTITVTLDPGNSADATLPQLTGTGPIDYLAYEFPPPPGMPCAISLSTAGSQASVVRLAVEAVLDPTGKAPPKFGNLELWFDPGAPTETVNSSVAPMFSGTAKSIGPLDVSSWIFGDGKLDRLLQDIVRRPRGRMPRCVPMSKGEKSDLLH